MHRLEAMFVFVLGLPALFAGLALAFPGPLVEQELDPRSVPLTPSNACVTGVHVVAAPGGIALSYGYLSSFVRNVTRIIPDSNNFVLGPYPNGGNLTGLDASEGGESQLRQHLADYNSSCPDTPIALVGYSAGAIITMNTLCGASPAPPWTPSTGVVYKYNIIAAIMYGDETYVANMPYNNGSCTNNSPNHTRTDIFQCKRFEGRMKSYCNYDDDQCCTGGTNHSAHFTYPDQYDRTASHFVKAQWNRWLKTHPLPPPSKRLVTRVPTFE